MGQERLGCGCFLRFNEVRQCTNTLKLCPLSQWRRKAVGSEFRQIDLALSHISDGSYLNLVLYGSLTYAFLTFPSRYKLDKTYKLSSYINSKTLAPSQLHVHRYKIWLMTKGSVQ